MITALPYFRKCCDTQKKKPTANKRYAHQNSVHSHTLLNDKGLIIRNLLFIFFSILTQETQVQVTIKFKQCIDLFFC